MEIRNLRTFLAVADGLSFHLAAERLHYAQSTVSAQISSLEEELEVRLFDRMGRGILLTQAGHHLQLYARKMLALEEEAKADIGEGREATGNLTIRVPESFCVHHLPPALALFRERMPRVGLHFITCAQEGIQRDLRKGIIDLAFLFTDSVSAGDVEFEVLGNEDLVLVAAPTHKLAQKELVETSDLNSDTLLLSRVDCSYRRLLQAMLDQDGGQPGMVLEFNSVAAIISCLAQGMGISLLPWAAARGPIDRGDLCRLNWREDPLEVACLMLWHKEKWLSPGVKGFMAAAREAIRPGLN